MKPIPPEQASILIDTGLALIAPHITAIVIQSKWTKQQKVYGAFFTSFALALGKCYLSGQIKNTGDILISLAIIFPMAQVINARVSKYFGVEKLQVMTDIPESQPELDASSPEIAALVQAEVARLMAKPKDEIAGEGE